jgi:hypothetical protein
VTRDPEQRFGPTSELQEYFVRKLYLDVSSIKPFTRDSFLALVDNIGASSDKTIGVAGKIVTKYDLQVEGRFDWRKRVCKGHFGKGSLNS